MTKPQRGGTTTTTTAKCAGIIHLFIAFTHLYWGLASVCLDCLRNVDDD